MQFFLFEKFWLNFVLVFNKIYFDCYQMKFLGQETPLWRILFLLQSWSLWSYSLSYLIFGKQIYWIILNTSFIVFGKYLIVFSFIPTFLSLITLSLVSCILTWFTGHCFIEGLLFFTATFISLRLHNILLWHIAKLLRLPA